MVRKRRFLRSRYLGMGTFIATLLFAGMHQKLVLEPMVASVEARRAADFVTGRLQAQLTPVPERKEQQASFGIDALLQKKLQALLADSQTPPPQPPITHAYYPKSIPH